MKTKSFFLWILLVLTAVSCKYDDGELWDKVNSLDNRLTNIETQLTQMNTDISSVGTIVNALNEKVYVSSVENTDNGYVINFSDGQSTTITNGKPGKDAPVIGVNQFEGEYYWTQILDGNEQWLTDEDGNKIPVSGDDAVIPQLKVDANGYWVISYDSGLTFTQLLGDDGSPVKAVGENGEAGDSWFTNVEVKDNGDGTQVLVVTFNGEEFELPIQSKPLEKLDKIAMLTENIGNWDKAYVTRDGYFLYRSGMSAVPEARSGETDDKYDYLSYMSLDKKMKVNILLSKDEKLPVQIVFEDKTSLYFSYLDDEPEEETVLELVYDDGEKMEKVSSHRYSYAEWETIKAEYVSEDVLKQALSYFNFLVKESGYTLPSVGELAETFDDVLSLEISVDINVDILGLEKNDEGFVFVSDVDIVFEVVVEKIFSELALWTGEASFKVGGSSCTLKGSIWCASQTFGDYGVYGIVCDMDKSKLKIDANPEFSGTGIQTDKEFEVDFRGLKPHTTYYYRAYYKFNDSDHGDLKFVNNVEVSEDGQVGYDMVIKEFTTGDNTLNVDVVMCMDVTGSMSGLINTVKTNALNFYDIFDAACVESGITLSSLNTQVVAFRDKNVDADWLLTSDVYAMPDEREQFSAFVNGLGADGGGDTPESGLEALDVAFSKDDWGKDDGYHRQVVILWTDAPYLMGSDYTDLTVEGVQTKWDDMPSGRRLVLFAPNGTQSNGGSWSDLDSWTNVMHLTNTATGFEDIDYVIENIIGELTGKGRSELSKMQPSRVMTVFTPNY